MKALSKRIAGVSVNLQTPPKREKLIEMAIIANFGDLETIKKAIDESKLYDTPAENTGGVAKSDKPNTAGKRNIAD